jgi:hypothetical protein
MEPDLFSRRKQTAAEFWKAYFAKFQRRVEENEVSVTLPATLLSEATHPTRFPERRLSGLRRIA